MTYSITPEQAASVTNQEMVMGIERLMPARKDIPEEFWDRDNPWAQFASSWFFGGISIRKTQPKKGFNSKASLRCLKALLRSWEFSHEHKEAGIAYMASLMFDKIDWSKK